MQEIIVLLIILTAFSITLYKLIKAIKKPSQKCDGCALKDNCSK